MAAGPHSGWLALLDACVWFLGPFSPGQVPGVSVVGVLGPVPGWPCSDEPC